MVEALWLAHSASLFAAPITVNFLQPSLKFLFFFSLLFFLIVEARANLFPLSSECLFLRFVYPWRLSGGLLVTNYMHFFKILLKVWEVLLLGWLLFCICDVYVFFSLLFCCLLKVVDFVLPLRECWGGLLVTATIFSRLIQFSIVMNL